MSRDIPPIMAAVLLNGFGDYDQLDYRTDVPVPTPQAGEVLIRVHAAGVNNTDINTRTGWYSKSVREGTTELGEANDERAVDDDGGWSGALEFPRIQGADVAGTIVATHETVDDSRIGDRVIVRTMQAALDSDDPDECAVIGSEFDGGFAQYCVVRADESFTVNTDLSDVELAALPCAWSTAEGMLDRIGLAEGERVLITGASGGVGSAAVALARRRGADVVAVAGSAKLDAVKALGANRVVDRSTDLIDAFGHEAFDVVVDVVAGAAFPALLEVLRKRGRYVTAGAIAGPIVELDVRTLYLKDLTLAGTTVQPRRVFENLVRYIEAGEIRPLIAATWPLAEIVAAQEHFVAKGFVGKLVLIPPA